MKLPHSILLSLTCFLFGESFAAAGEAWWENSGALPGENIPIPSVIDQEIAAKLADRKVTPAAQADPETRLRRVMLDLQGRIPTITETDRFLAETDPNRWVKWVDALIGTPEFDRFQAHELNWLLMDGKGTEFQGYLDLAVAGRRGWDDLFREMIAGQADGDTLKGVDFFLRERISDTDKLANDVSVRFFGVNISCAQCHDHPYVEDWTQETYYGMKSFFSRTFENGGFVGEREYGLVSYKTTSGEEKNAALRFLGGEAIEEPKEKVLSEEEKKAEKKLLEEYKKKKQAPPPAKYSRRARLIEASLSREREEWFARSIVNRIWHRLFGHGLVMPLDQMHGKNEPSHPELMQWLARDLIAHDYDLRRLIRGIVLSETYQRASVWESGDRPPLSLFAVSHPRPLNPRQYAVAMKFGTAAPATFAADLSAEEVAKRIESTERSGTGLARWFERPGENFHVSVDEALLFSNSAEVQSQLFANGGLFSELQKIDSAEEKIRLATRSILVREPDPEELGILSAYLAEREDRPDEAIRQLLWVLLGGTEARFNY